MFQQILQAVFAPAIPGAWQLAQMFRHFAMPFWPNQQAHQASLPTTGKTLYGGSGAELAF